MFIDEVEIKLIAWSWWDWIVSWRREKYIPKWWPRWWNWGDWGNIFLETDSNLNTLSSFRHKKMFKAKSWERWWTQNMNWEAWEDLILKIPVWTIVKDKKTGKIIADLDKNNQKLLIAKWWKWWYWNSHFVSSTRQAPRFAELWDIWEEKNLNLELKLVADIWIIWIPSAWKSSLINVLTDVKAKVWEYPFTTLVPNLWVMEHKWKSLVLEDVPWLIPWASKWKWLWINFLKHIERTWILLHLVDLYRLDKAFKDYEDIRKELKYFSPSLAKKQEIIILSKADLLDNDMINMIKKEFEEKYPKKKIFIVSSANSFWIENLKDYLINNVKTKKIIDNDIDKKDEIKIYDLKDNSDANNYKLKYLWELKFEISWERIEQIVRMTDFYNPEAVARVYDVLEKIWAIKKIESQLKKIFDKEKIDDNFYYEWWSDEDNSPKVLIGNKILKLDKLKYNL